MDKVANWRKASYSSTNGGACIEAGNTDCRIVVRDSKKTAGPTLGFSRENWLTFTRSLKAK